MVVVVGAETSWESGGSDGMKISVTVASEVEGAMDSDLSVGLTDIGGKGVSGNRSDGEDGVDTISSSSITGGFSPEGVDAADKFSSSAVDCDGVVLLVPVI